MRLDIYHHADQRVVDKLDMILATQEILMDNADRIIADVQAQKTVIDGLKAFIAGLKGQIADALAGAKLSAEHEAKLAAIFPDLEANTDAITQAITTQPDGSPAPAPTPDPVPAPDPAPTNDATLPPDSNAPASQKPSTL